MLGPDLARGPNTPLAEFTMQTETDAKTLTKKKSRTDGATAEVHTDEGEIKGPTQLQVRDIEGSKEVEGSVVALKPPAGLFKSPQMHPSQIFVSH